MYVGQEGENIENCVDRPRSEDKSLGLRLHVILVQIREFIEPYDDDNQDDGIQ